MIFKGTKTIAVSFIVLTSLPVWSAKITNPKCKDFVKINEKFTPEYMAFIDGYGRRGAVPAELVDVEGIVTESVQVKEECAKDKAAKVQTVRKGLMKPAKVGTAANSLQGDIDRKSKSTINLTKAKCTDFIALGEEYQPVAAFWVAGHSKTGKIINGEIEEEYLERPVATLIEECKAEPTASFYDKTKAWFKKHI